MLLVLRHPRAQFALQGALSKETIRQRLHVRDSGLKVPHSGHSAAQDLLLCIRPHGGFHHGYLVVPCRAKTLLGEESSSAESLS